MMNGLPAPPHAGREIEIPLTSAALTRGVPQAADPRSVVRHSPTTRSMLRQSSS